MKNKIQFQKGFSLKRNAGKPRFSGAGRKVMNALSTADQVIAL